MTNVTRGPCWFSFLFFIFGQEGKKATQAHQITMCHKCKKWAALINKFSQNKGSAIASHWEGTHSSFPSVPVVSLSWAQSLDSNIFPFPAPVLKETLMIWHSMCLALCWASYADNKPVTAWKKIQASPQAQEASFYSWCSPKHIAQGQCKRKGAGAWSIKLKVNTKMQNWVYKIHLSRNESPSSL